MTHGMLTICRAPRHRDTTRYRYKHSILLKGKLGGIEYGGGQRLSVMVRVRILSHFRSSCIDGLRVGPTP